MYNLQKKETLFLIIITLSFIVLSLFISGTIVRGDIIQPADENNTILLIAGKNNVTFNSVTFAADVVLRNPFIETISYYDQRTETTIGYVNIFGGIGKNFLIIPGVVYQVSVRNDSILQL